MPPEVYEIIFVEDGAKKTNRYAVGFQNRILKGIHGLTIIDQYAANIVQILQAAQFYTVDEGESAQDQLEV